MDNQEKIRYKQSTGPLVKKIDIATGSVMAEFNTDQPKRYAGLIAEMQAWIDAGNEIEPQLTEAELEAKKIKDAEDALEALHDKAYEELKRVEYRISNHPPHPEDLEQNKIYIDQLRAAMVSKTLIDMPIDPFKGDT
jgi:predicted  nucleic acid-binding Zn-ribbon protein